MADIKRRSAARNVKLATLPVGFAGRAALGFGKRLTGKSKDEVTAELIEHCRANLAHFKAPKKVVFGELPKTSTGKIQKNVLRDQAKSASAIG